MAAQEHILMSIEQYNRLLKRINSNSEQEKVSSDSVSGSDKEITGEEQQKLLTKKKRDEVSANNSSMHKERSDVTSPSTAHMSDLHSVSTHKNGENGKSDKIQGSSSTNSMSSCTSF